MIDPKRVARELAKEILKSVVGSDEDCAALEDELTTMLEARIGAEFQRHIENIEKVTGKKAGA